MCQIPVLAQLSLYEALERVPDPRKRRGVRHPLAAVLTLAAVAVLCGCRSLSAIAAWGRRNKELARWLGFTRSQPPCTSNLHYIFAGVDHGRLEAILAEWMVRQGARDIKERATTLAPATFPGAHGEPVPGLQLLSAYALELQEALDDLRMHERPTKAALELLNLIPSDRKLVSHEEMVAASYQPLDAGEEDAVLEAIGS
jgi:hypothetical protein